MAAPAPKRVARKHPTPKDTTVWRSARGSLPTKPSRKAFSAGSWVKWTGTNGRDYHGIVSNDRATLHQVTGEVATGSRSARVKAVIIPADGSEILPLALPNANHWKAEAKQAGRWIQVQRMDMEEAA